MTQQLTGFVLHATRRKTLACTVAVGCRYRALSVSSSSSSKNESLPSYSPVVIIGGGPVGLLLSNLLSYNYKVPSILLEAQTVQERFRHPQAHFLNTRTMEILKHWLPAVYERVQLEMPPVDQWKSFRFVSSMSQANPILAQVVHPVDRPLQANRDANGVLLEDDNDNKAYNNMGDEAADLSVCSVGHLAQHTFCRILYEHAVALEGTDTALLYGTRAANVYTMNEQEDNNNRVVVETGSGHTIATNLVVAADGAHSMIRHIRGIPFKGKEAIQHLINIHVKLPMDQATRLHFQHNGQQRRDKTMNHAMLYSVFSPQVVAMVVCHSIGEYIIQIPYFPPYQTLEDDFSGDKLNTVLQGVFGPAIDKWVLHSVRPWTMSSLIAERYFDEAGIALIGDAAHVFPPAGGFGMNTGLQDAHNLAWKLAWAFHNDRLKERSVRNSVLQSYETERRPVAQANAALSVRNYQRLLQVTKSLYLHEKHPALLKTMLDQSPLPFTARQSIFRSLLQTALYPLSWIEQPDSTYTKHIRGNLRRILRTGAGLPLLFPNFEIGFGYYSSTGNGRGTNSSPQSDTWASFPVLKVGRLVPHTEMLVVSGGNRYPALQMLPAKSRSTITTSDLSAQLSRSPRPTFVLVCVGVDSSQVKSVAKVADAIANRIGSPVEIVHVVPIPDNEVSSGVDGLVLCEPEGAKNERFSFFSDSDQVAPYLLLVRPDGHVASSFLENIRLVDAESAVESLCDPLANMTLPID